jgi:ribosomal protein S18 acetylase RimI-like enzyme
VELSPFDAADAAVVASWPQSSREAAMWCGSREFPVPAQTVASCQREDDVRARVLLADDSLVGYGELWTDPAESEVELARLIVGPGQRRKGMGQVLVRRLLSEARDAGYSDIFLRVHPDNDPALRCYRRTGFMTVDAGLAAAWNVGQPVGYVWLRHDGAAEGS